MKFIFRDWPTTAMFSVMGLCVLLIVYAFFMAFRQADARIDDCAARGMTYKYVSDGIGFCVAPNGQVYYFGRNSLT